MALNWVMLSTPPTQTHPFIPLPNERTLFTSSPRTTLSLTTPKSTYPAHSANLHVSSSDGTLHLTNQRLIYLPTPKSTISTNTATFKSFSAPLLNLHDTHLVMPWFGPNSWTALVQPVPGGNISVTSVSSGGMELKVTFKDGGAPEFQGKFEAVKERLQQVVEAARERNAALGVSSSGPGGVDLTSVHLDQLPSYQEHGQDRVAMGVEEQDVGGGAEGVDEVPRSATAEEVRAMAAAAATRREQESSRRRSRQEEEDGQTPVDAPPGYEEAQQSIVEDELARRLERV